MYIVHCFVLKIPLIRKFGLIFFYRFSCSSCNATYYDKTYRHFFTRAEEHMVISNLTGKGSNDVKESTVSDNLLQCDCTIDFDLFDILSSDTNSFGLFIKENVLIKCEKLILNRTVESFPLKLFD